MIPNMARPEAANPVQVARRRGNVEKEKIPSSANLTILNNENLVTPASRGARRYSTAV